MTKEEPRRRLEVVRRELVAEATVALTLAGDGPLPPWAPGAHIDVETPAGPRQYSLCGEVGESDRWRIAVLREADGRGGSAALFDAVGEGDRVTVGGPRNHFPLVEAERYLFVAGGIGITPILAMIGAADAAGADWRLLYGGRTSASMAFVDALAGHGDRVVLRPQDEHGFLDVPGALADAAAGTRVYCCGPEGLIAAAERACLVHPELALHVERFAPREPVDLAVGRQTFEVTCARSGLTVEVPLGRSILDVLRDAGVDVLSSCSEGTCGSCEVEVVDGRPDHRDSFLTPAERESDETMLICVSRSHTAHLTLDL